MPQTADLVEERMGITKRDQVQCQVRSSSRENAGVILSAVPEPGRKPRTVPRGRRDKPASPTNPSLPMCRLGAGAVAVVITRKRALDGK